MAFGLLFILFGFQLVIHRLVTWSLGSLIWQLMRRVINFMQRSVRQASLIGNYPLWMKDDKWFERRFSSAVIAFRRSLGKLILMWHILSQKQRFHQCLLFLYYHPFRSMIVLSVAKQHWLESIFCVLYESSRVGSWRNHRSHRLFVTLVI